MKKFIFSAIAAIGLLLSPSCSDENEALSGSGNEALVSFSVNLADGIQTKADPTTTTTLGDGTKAKKLVVDVFEKNTSTNAYTRIPTLRNTSNNEDAFNNELEATVNFNLVKGKTYRFIFWAQKQSVDGSVSSPYDITDLSQIKVNYDANIENDEDRDAFLAVTEDITVSGNFSKSITMTRPFAQLNYLIDKAEYDAAILALTDIKKAEVTVARVATQLNPLTNSVSEQVNDVTFEVNDFPTDFSAANLEGENHLVLPKAGVTQDPANPTNEKYYYLASKYFLVYAGDGAADKAGDPATLATTSFKLINSSDEEIANYEFSLPNVPVRCNYRTNIYGNLITSQGTFEVTIDPILNGESNKDNNLPQYAVIVNSVEEINNAINEKKATTFIASKDFQLSTTSENPTTITVPKNYASGNNGVELTFDLSKATVTSGTAEIKITEGTSATDTQSLPENVNVIASGNVTINLPTSHVTLNGNEVSGGTYNTVTASTSGTTLVVPNGVTVNTLKVKKGNVRIEKGGTVGTIVRTEDNVDEGNTIVFLEDGGVLTNTPNESSKIIVVQPAIISNAAELRAFAEAVNKGYTYAGETVVLNADIDLNNVEWTPIGANADDAAHNFQGTFDGQGHTIKNFKVAQGNEYKAAGFFGALNGTAKNFTIENATIVSESTGNAQNITDNGVAVVAGSIYTSGLIENVTVRNSSAKGHHYVAGIAGYVYGNIKNCTVENSQFVCTPHLKNGSTTEYENGDKAGGIVGYICGEPQSLVKGCSVKNLTVTAYRDVAGIAGCASGTVAIENNTVDKVTVIANMLQDGGKTLADANAKEVVGRNLANADLSTNTTNNVTVTIYGIDNGTATVGTDAGVTYAIKKGITTIRLTPGTYIIPDAAQGKALTFIGTGNPEDTKIATQDDGSYEGCDYSLDGATVTFENITINTDSETYTGYARCNGTYKNCVINGTYTLYGDSKFEDCTFNVSGNVYNIWTWGAPNAKFDKCTFNSDGKAMLLYGTENTNLTIENSVFNDNGGLTDLKAAIEIGNDYSKSYILVVNNTVVNGYEINDKGINTGTTLWANKNSMGTDKLSVTVDGVKVY